VLDDLYKHRQKWLRNLVSRLDTIDKGKPWRRYTSLKYNCATLTASAIFLHAIKCTILENLSTTTKTESLPFWVLGKPNTKSTLTFVHGCCGIGKGKYNPTLVVDPFDLDMSGNSSLACPLLSAYLANRTVQPPIEMFYLAPCDLRHGIL
jgi:hypothetical protein